MKAYRLQRSSIVECSVILLALWGCAVLIYLFLPNAALILPAAGLVSLLLILAWRFPAKAQKAADFCFRCRWRLALLVFLVCVGLRLHGSSIGVFDQVLPTRLTGEKSLLFGEPRWIRSDEYGVTTLKYFSQAANDYRLYSQRMSLSPTNMVLDFYSPVWDWTILGKPLSWGFLLFGNEIGLSWYWCGEIILIFMTALEMFLILTGGMRRVSLIGAVMITLSPAIQWWVMPHMPPAILYAMALFCLGYWFFTAKTRLSKWSAAGLAAIAAIGFVLSIFPSFQVPCAYTVLVLLIVCLRRDRAMITFTRREWPRFALPAAAALLILGGFFLRSRADLSLLLNTVYPGRRMCLGGYGTIATLFTDLTSFFLPYQNINFSNNCEAATYIQFAPLFLVLAPYLLPALKRERDDSWTVGAALCGILLVQGAYLLIGFPQWLAEVSLLRFCNRMHEVYGWTATLFTVWGLSVLDRHPDLPGRRIKCILPLLYGAVCLLLVDGARKDYFSGFAARGLPVGKALLVLALAGVVCALYFALFRRQRLLSAALILAMVFCGATVNPLMRGIGPVVDHPISASIAEMAEREPEERWMTLDCPNWLTNFVLANGARVLDAANFYPDVDKWAILDPAGQYGEFTNRYANECAELTEGENTVELLGGDYIKILLNPTSLKELRIHYLFSPMDYTDLLSDYGIACSYVTGQDGYGIYRLDYTE